MIRKAVILAGGLATRFMPFCKSIPKEMLPIINKPIIHYLVEELSENGITDILIITGRNKECIENYFDKNIELENRLIATGKNDILEQVDKVHKLANISFIRQIEPKGTGHALLKAKNFVGDEPFFMLFGDELFFNPKNSITKQMLSVYTKSGAENLISSKRVPKSETFKYGIIKSESADFKNEEVNYNSEPVMHKILDFVEKPKIENAPSNLSYLGMSIFSPSIFNILETLKPNGLEITLTDAFKPLFLNNKLYAVEVQGTRLDSGNSLGFIQANLFYAMQNENLRDKLKSSLKDLEKL